MAVAKHDAKPCPRPASPWPTLVSCSHCLSLESQSMAHKSPPSPPASPPNALTCPSRCRVHLRGEHRQRHLPSTCILPGILSLGLCARTLQAADLGLDQEPLVLQVSQKAAMHLNTYFLLARQRRLVQVTVQPLAGCCVLETYKLAFHKHGAWGARWVALQGIKGGGKGTECNVTSGLQVILSIKSYTSAILGHVS